MAKHKMYDENPRLEHDEEGNVKVKKDAPKETAGDTGEPDGEDIKLMMKTHKEMVDMHNKHQEESLSRITKHATKPGATSGSDDVGAPIKDIEKGAK